MEANNSLTVHRISYANAKSLNRDLIYLQMASIWSQNSMATRAKVGALVVKDSLILSDGYNGMPAGFSNCCEHAADDSITTNKEVLHAESNALMKLAKFGGIGSNNAIMYCTYSPCIECAKLIVQAGIKQVHFLHFYHNLDGLQLLVEAGIECYFHAVFANDALNNTVFEDDIYIARNQKFVQQNVFYCQHVNYAAFSNGNWHCWDNWSVDKRCLIIDMSAAYRKLTPADCNNILGNLKHQLLHDHTMFECKLGFIDMNGHVFVDAASYDMLFKQVVPVDWHVVCN